MGYRHRTLFLLFVMAGMVAAAWGEAAAADTRPPSIKLSVKYDLDSGILHGILVGFAPKGVKTSLLVPKGLKVWGIESGGKALSLAELSKRTQEGKGARFSLNFSLRVGVKQRQFALSWSWCPTWSVPAVYSLSVAVPKGFTAISEADTIEKKTNDSTTTYRFQFRYPRRRPSLVVGKYTLTQESRKGISIEVYLLDPDPGLSKTYLQKAAHYIDLYSKLLGPYPYRRFAVVENGRPTGYGFATYTLLGRNVIRLPFIPDTSLPHEIVHSWFGNGVKVANGASNWCEGLTTYLSDYLLREREGKGTDQRHSMLLKLNSYAPKKGMSLARFWNQPSKRWRAVGYEKGAMFFHLLRREVGDDQFWKGLRLFFKRHRYKEVRWKEIRLAMEEVSGDNLSGLFKQWLATWQLPEIEIEKAVAREAAKGFQVCLTVVQGGDNPFTMNLPVTLNGANGESLDVSFPVSKPREERCFAATFKPLAVVLDPGFDTIRRLDPKEAPATVSSLLGADPPLYSAPIPLPEKVSGLIQGLGFKKASPPSSNRGALLLVSPELEPLLSDAREKGISIPSKWIAEHRLGIVKERGASLHLFRNRGRGMVVGLLLYREERDAEALLNKLPHYGKYQAIEVDKGIVVTKNRPGYSAGIERKVEEGFKVKGIKASALDTLDEIVASVSNKRVVFVGERHDDYATHLAQLEVIRALRDTGAKLAVGMEMFQRPFQEVIDDFMAGKISKKEFLKRTEYFKRWGYDFRLYEPIIDFCKANGIPIIALNLKAEISKKVARHGLDALSDEERAIIPKELDMENEEYREMLKQIFYQHPPKGPVDFDNFYSAQLLWDETMADSIATFLSGHPGTIMVVLAGSGHVAYGYGIPSRVKRRGHDYAILLCDTEGGVSSDRADYFLFPEQARPPFTAKLGVYLDEFQGRLQVKEVMEGSPAYKGGVKPGDIILTFSSHKGEPVEIKDITDLKLELFFVRPDDVITLTVKRPLKFRPDQVLELRIGPFGPAMPHSPHKARSSTHGRSGKSK